MEMQKSFMANIMQQLLQSRPNSSVEFLGMQQHYWQPKLLTVCLHTLNNKNTLPKAVIITKLCCQIRRKLGCNILEVMFCTTYTKKHGRTNSVESQQAMAILKAGKLESITDSSQKLVSALNRGSTGSWQNRSVRTNSNPS